MYHNKTIQAFAGSFRDPRGYVARNEKGEIYRSIKSSGFDAYQSAETSGLYQHLFTNKMLIEHTPVDITEFDQSLDAKAILHHTCIPFISYPYEWCFEQLKSAALLQLEIYLECLNFNQTLTDATAFNIQFMGADPVFIDTLSFTPYKNGMFWKGQQQFADQFLNPLLLSAYTGLAFNDAYRGSMQGISPEIIRKTLPLHKKISFKYLNYIFLPAISDKKMALESSREKRTIKGSLPKEGFRFILKQLYNWIDSLENYNVKSLWSDYTGNRTYNDETLTEKVEFITAAIGQSKPKLLLDIGCNTGEFSLLAVKAGAEYVVGIEYDHLAVSKAYKAAQKSEGKFLPIYQNILNPSPAQGWASEERESFKSRLSTDFSLSLAVIHHIVFSGNVPLDRALNYITELASEGIIEWVPKNDPMVEVLLQNRDDIFDSYNEDYFVECLNQLGFSIKSSKKLANGRVLYHYSR
jgi:SAM-dependent methyltransferase